MSLTPEEQKELREIEAQLRALDAQEQGQKSVDRALPSPKEDSVGFGILRTGLNIIRKPIQGVIDTVSDLDDTFGDLTGWGGFSFGSAASNGILEYHSYDEQQKRGGNILKYQLPVPRGTEQSGTFERVVTEIGAFAVPFVGWARAFGAFKAASSLRFGAASRIGRSAAAGAITDFTQDDAINGNIANVMKDAFGFDNAVLNSLASENDDDTLADRFKAAAAGTAVGLVADSAIEAGIGLTKMYRAWKGTHAEHAAIVADAKLSRGLNAADRELPEAAQSAAEGAAKGSPKATTETAEGAAEAAPKATTMDPTRDPSAITEISEVVTYLERKIADDITDEAAQDIYSKLMGGDTASAFARIGIDPSKINWAKLDDPDTLKAFHERLAEIIEKVSKQTGRTGETVATEATVRAGRVLAETTDALKVLTGRTGGLAERLSAARIIVEAHSHRLMTASARAAEEIMAGGANAGPAWAEFLETFHRHAYYIGAVRGAGSEVGRALRSLRYDVSMTSKQAGKMIDDGLQKEPSASPFQNRLEDVADDFMHGLTTDAQKLEALARINSHEADIGNLTKYVRQKNMTGLTRLDAVMGETRGNLFSDSTLTLNLGAGGMMAGLRVLERPLMALTRFMANPLKQGNRDAARAHLMESWAYSSGVLGGLRDATRDTVNIFKREIGAELAINADALGLRALATKVATISYKAAASMKNIDYIRDDVVNNRLFSMTSTEADRIAQTITGTDGPAFVEQGMKALMRVLAAPVNLAGSFTRLGTMAFITMPDQFVGSAMARAGARAGALRRAAEEASEYGLHGKELGDFLKARVTQATEDVSGYAVDDAWLKGEQEAAHAMGNVEARQILFQDPLELAMNRKIVEVVAATPVIGNLLVPFAKTPLRILERVSFDYTPVGLLNARIQKALLAGGPQRDEAMARLMLGMTMTTTALALAEDGTIVGSDGGWTSTGRVGRPTYSVKLGGEVYDISKIEPIGTVMGWAVDVKQMMDAYGDDPEAPGLFEQAFASFTLATANNILSKSWMESISDMVELATATYSAEDGDSGGAALKKWVSSFAARLTPGAGISRAANRKTDPYMREAQGFVEEAIRQTVFADKLPIKRDNLGRPIELMMGEKVMGARSGPVIDPNKDPLGDELETLSFDWGRVPRTVEGVRLNAGQYSRFKELRGQIVTKDDHGLTMEEALTALIALPEYKALPRAAKVEEIRKEMKGYTKLAKIELLKEDDSLARRVAAKDTWAAGELEGLSRDEKKAATQQLLTELGL